MLPERRLITKFFRMQRLINPPGSAYRSETGGLMEALRALTIEQSVLCQNVISFPRPN